MGSFPASAIIGKPFGFTYEIVPPASTSNKGKDTCTLVVKDDLPVTNIGNASKYASISRLLLTELWDDQTSRRLKPQTKTLAWPQAHND